MTALDPRALEAALWLAVYVSGAIGVWRLGPLSELTDGGWRDLSTPHRVFACLIWPITLLQMWDP